MLTHDAARATLGYPECSCRAVVDGWSDYRDRLPGAVLDAQAEDKNVNVVLVLDLNKHEVMGHHLLNLNRLYGLDKE